jgi:NAD(P)-dependent dehydrogenase (short-subunit alcohol dehydrogenase family)
MSVPGVLVTGAGSGIGLAIARLLAASDFRVFAGVHRASGKLGDGICEVVLDVTSADSIAAARREIEGDLGGEGLFAIVNNAGVGDVMPLEFTPLERFRQTFDVNVFGVVAVTQTFLPLVHKARGRIVNIGSVGGMITIPFGAALTASKHAIESISDALRLELYAAGIHVTCIQPASINSGSAEKLASKTEETIAALPPEAQRRYGSALRGFVKTMLESETEGSPPEAVAQAVLAVLRAKKPPARKLVGKGGLLLKVLARDVPEAARDALLRKLFLGNPVFGSQPGSSSAD